MRPPPDWRRPPGRPRSTWLRVIDEDVQSQKFGSTRLGRRQGTGILGIKSSVRQRSARSSPLRRIKSLLMMLTWTDLIRQRPAMTCTFVCNMMTMMTTTSTTMTDREYFSVGYSIITGAANEIVSSKVSYRSERILGNTVKTIVTMRRDLNAQTNKSLATAQTVLSRCPFA